jgi:S1-C subfamily serine protease
MSERFFNLGPRATRAGVAVGAALLLVTGAAWRGVVAQSPSAAARATAPVTTPIMHAVAGGRDSYADVVQVVAPAVVTIRTQGKPRVSPTDFQGDGDSQGEDFFRRFFGDQFGEQGGGRPNMPRMPRSKGSALRIASS